jgi:hypothetical protein
MAEPITFDFTVDARALSKIWMSLQWWRIAMLYAIGAFFLYFLLVALTSFSPILMLLVFPAFIGLGVTQYALIEAPKHYRQYAGKAMRIEVDDAELTVRSDGIESKLSWPKIRRVRQSGRFWLLYYGEHHYVAIPIQESGSQIERLRELLIQKRVTGADQLELR